MLEDFYYRNINYYILLCIFVPFCIIADAMYPNLDQSDSLPLENLMNGPVRKALGIQVTHGKQSDRVFTALREDFMKPVIHIGNSQIYQKNVIATKVKERNTCG